MAKKQTRQEPEMVSPDEAAALLGVSRRTIFRMVESGMLRGKKKTPFPKSAIMIYRDSVEEADKAREIPPKN